MQNEWIFMADIWLHRKQALIRVINQVTDTDRDDLDISVVLNVLWTADEEDRDYLNATLKGMISGSFDEFSYSRSFLEQLDLICSMPIPVSIESKVDAEDVISTEENVIEDSEIDDDEVDINSTNLQPNKDHCWLFSFLFFIAILSCVYFNKATFDKEAMLASLPKWPYFWFEFVAVVTGFIFTAYIMKSFLNRIAEYVATIGYLLLFMPLLCIVNGFIFSSPLWLYSCWGLSIIFITLLSRICSRKTTE